MNHMIKQPDLLRDIDKTLANIRTVIEAKRGLLGPDAIEAYDRMKKIDSSETRAALADQLVTILSRRLQESWPVLYESLRLVRDFEIYKQPEWLSGRAMEPFPDFETYFINRMGKPFDLFVEMESTYHFADKFHPKWKEMSLKEASRLTRQEVAAQTRQKVLEGAKDPDRNHGQIALEVDVSRPRVVQILQEEKVLKSASGNSKTLKEISEETGVSLARVTEILQKRGVNETSTVDVSFTPPIRETKPQIAAKNGISRYQQHRLDKIAKYPDLQQSFDTKTLSVSKAYDIAMEREGKPRDRVSPILRMFDKLSHEEQIRTGRAIITKLGWVEEYNHGS